MDGDKHHHREPENLKGRVGEACHPRRESDFHLIQEPQKGAGGQPMDPLLPGLPASLQRALTRRTGSHLPEPNLSRARRIRNVSGNQKSETKKESGLSPTVRQFISGSRRNIIWERFTQQVIKKKQELSKGFPRFGIEVVPQEFFWGGASVGCPEPMRKRSFSESSVPTDKAAALPSVAEGTASVARPRRLSLPTALDSHFRISQAEGQDVPEGPGEGRGPASAPVAPAPPSVEGAATDSSCTSGHEEKDDQGVGTKSRAAAASSSSENPDGEDKEIKTKECSQVEKLLTLSLSEEELSESLKSVDERLLQNQLVVQAAQTEIQQLLLMKQQMSVEMGTLRSQRIQILQSLQESKGEKKEKKRRKGKSKTIHPETLDDAHTSSRPSTLIACVPLSISQTTSHQPNRIWEQESAPLFSIQSETFSGTDD